MTHQRLTKQGFTLVEILVVIAIVALLAGLLFPVFSNARESGRIATCASNLKQIGTAIALYANDNRERYPLIVNDQNSLNGCTWVDAIYPYAKSTQVFSCPSAKYGDYVPGCGPPNTIIGGALGEIDGLNGSYDLVSPFIEAVNIQNPTGSSGGYNVYGKSLSVSRYRFPSSTILALDGSDTSYFFHNNYAVVNPGIDKITSIADLKDGGVLPRHREGVNLLYVDGHVKWQKLESLTSTPMWRYDGREPVPAPTPPN